MRQVVRDCEVHAPEVQNSAEATDTSSPTLPAAGHSVDSEHEATQPATHARRLGWAGVGGLIIGGGILVVTGQSEIGALAGAAAMVATSWILGYRGRVHRWPGLLNDARNRDTAAR